MSTKALSVTVIDESHFQVAIPAEGITVRTRALFEASNIRTVTNPAEQARAIQAVATLKGLSKEVEKLRESIKLPFWNTCKAIDAKAKEYIGEVNARISEIEGELGSYERRERERVAAEQAAENRRRQEAQEAARREQERLADIARREAMLEKAIQDAKTKKAREAAEKEAQRLREEQAQAEIDNQMAQEELSEASATTVIAEPVKAQGQRVTTEYSFEVLNIDEFYAWDVARRKQNARLPSLVKIEVRTRELKEYIALISGTAEIPGLKITENTRSIVNSVSPSIALR